MSIELGFARVERRCISGVGCDAGRAGLGGGRGRSSPVPSTRRRTWRAWMEPSHPGAANACRVVARPLPPPSPARPESPISPTTASTPDPRPRGAWRASSTPRSPRPAASRRTCRSRSRRRPRRASGRPPRPTAAVMRSATTSGCSTTLVVESMTPGRNSIPSGSGCAAERLQLVLMPRAGERQRQRADPRPVDDRQERLERHVVRVRPVVVAPAEMQADPVGRNGRDGLVDRVDVQGDRAEEAVERLVLEEARALHREVGAVELKHEAARDDQLVLLAHLAGQRPDVALVRAVEGVEHDGGDHAGRRGRHERLREPAAPCRRRRARTDRTRRWPRPGPCSPPRPPPAARRRCERRPRAGVRAAPCSRDGRPWSRDSRRLLSPPKPRIRLRRVGREADARLLAVVADVDAGLELLGHDVTDGDLGLARERGGVHGLAPILPHQQVAKRRWTGQATDVGGQDPLFALFHGADCTTSGGGGRGGCRSEPSSTALQQRDARHSRGCSSRRGSERTSGRSSPGRPPS